jgi:hypothetical protein
MNRDLDKNIYREKPSKASSHQEKYVMVVTAAVIRDLAGNFDNVN